MTTGELDVLWRRVVAAIPSVHLGGHLLEAAFGVRLELVLHVVRQERAIRYLEVGVRRGHSLAFVALAAAAAGLELEALGVDLWCVDYAGEANPGPDYVRGRLEALRVGAGVELASGDSHDLLPKLERTFDLILIDGDHTTHGALADLEDAWRLLERGGVLLFDDAIYEGDPELLEVWRGFVETLPAGEAEVLEVIAPRQLDAAGIPAYCRLLKL